MPSTSSYSMIAAVLCLAASCTHVVRACGETLLSANFDSFSGGWQHFNTDLGSKEFPVGLKYMKGHERADVGEGTLRVEQPEGGVGPGGTGMLMRVNLPRQVDTATLSYRVKFDPGYDWTAGGKLPGLCDYECPTGCKDMNEHDGWSSRIMFREGGRAESYMYYPNMVRPGTCGLSWQTSKSFGTGTWHKVSLYIKLNTGGQANGEQKVWIDGNQVLSKNDVRFRNGGANQITQLKFESFHGGKTDVFKPSHTQFMMFDDFMVKEGYCPGGGDGDGGSTFVSEKDETPTPTPASSGRKIDPGSSSSGGGGISTAESDGSNDNQDDLPELPNNDDEMDDDENDSDRRKWECDEGYHNGGQGICVEWKCKGGDCAMGTCVDGTCVME